MKVICVHAGNQTSSARVEVGSVYTVIRHYTWAGDGRNYYDLEEMPEEMCYWVGLFATLPGEEETQQLEDINELELLEA